MVSRVLLFLAAFPLSPAAWAQTPDSTRDTVVTLPPISVHATRGVPQLNTAPLAVSVVDRATLGLARQGLTMDDVLTFDFSEHRERNCLFSGS